MRTRSAASALVQQKQYILTNRDELTAPSKQASRKPIYVEPV